MESNIILYLYPLFSYLEKNLKVVLGAQPPPRKGHLQQFCYHALEWHLPHTMLLSEAASYDVNFGEIPKVLRIFPPYVGIYPIMQIMGDFLTNLIMLISPISNLRDGYNLFIQLEIMLTSMFDNCFLAGKQPKLLPITFTSILSTCLCMKWTELFICKIRHTFWTPPTLTPDVLCTCPLMLVPKTLVKSTDSANDSGTNCRPAHVKHVGLAFGLTHISATFSFLIMLAKTKSKE